MNWKFWKRKKPNRSDRERLALMAEHNGKIISMNFNNVELQRGAARVFAAPMSQPVPSSINDVINNDGWYDLGQARDIKVTWNIVPETQDHLYWTDWDSIFA